MSSILATPQLQSAINTEVADYTADKSLIHAIRFTVFVQEQNIPLELEIDNYDPVSHHVLAFYGNVPVGTGRLAPSGKIGRVAVVRPWRRKGVGLQLMRRLFEVAKQNYHDEVVLSAQRHAIKFYEKLGFQSEGDEFLEVGIAHVTMRKQIS
ncbi:MAG: GNAT family N-acetyltransferase [Leptolyngbyaceae cyanobacterium]